MCQGKSAWKDARAGQNQYQYNGKELNEDLGLNWYAYGARYYDPAIGRFTGVDPISDQFPHVTTYNYAENEPIGHIDLWGLQKAKPSLLEKAGRWLGFDVGRGGLNTGRAGNDAQEWNRINDRVQALKQTEKDAEKVLDVQEALIPLAKGIRKAKLGDDLKGGLIDITVEGASEMFGAGLISGGGKLLKRVPKGQEWVKVADFLEGKTDGQKGGTFINDALEEAGGYIKKIGDSDNFDNQTRTFIEIRDAGTGKRDTWWGELLKLLDPSGDPGALNK